MNQMSKANKKYYGMKKKPLIGAPKKKNGWTKWNLRKYGKEHPTDMGRVRGDLREFHKQVLLYIRLYQHEKRFSPNIMTISRDFAVTKRKAKVALWHLVQKGFIEIAGPHNATQILFPKGVQFPWEDYKQFPLDIFDHREPHDYTPPPPLPDVALPKK